MSHQMTQQNVEIMIWLSFEFKLAMGGVEDFHFCFSLTIMD